jgi:hypothetical protein
MAWNTSNSYSASAALTTAILNGIGNDLRTWGGNVDAAANSLNSLLGINTSASAFHVVGPAGVNFQPWLTAPSGFGTFLELGPAATPVEIIGTSSGDFQIGCFGLAGNIFQVTRSGGVSNTLVLVSGRAVLGGNISTTYASNAAAVSAGLPVGAAYRITGSDNLAIVH